MKVAILGAGMVGRTIAIDLSEKFQVTSFDINNANLRVLGKYPGITQKQQDLVNFAGYTNMLKDYDLVVNAVPGFMGYRTLEAIIIAGKSVADISFFPENAFDLDLLAKKKNVTAIVDCGVAPGISNLVLGYYDTQMKINSFECMVGGLPKLRVKPFEYKAPFSPVDVIEEYTRPARYMKNGYIITRPALSDPEYIDFEKAGTLESFNTDGLRSILITMSHIPDMKEKTLRYPGHIDLIKSLQKAGFFSTQPLQVKGIEITPLDFTSALLLHKWKLDEGEAEFTIMKIIIKGLLNTEQTTVEYNLYDEYDPAQGVSSMSRTTGFTCNAFLNLIAENYFTEKGVIPPELVGKHAHCYQYILQYLEKRNVHVTKASKN